jgi:hypothetical protein
MTRGKEAVQAANRREQAARELCRSLTDEIAEAKAELKLERARNAVLRAKTARLDELDRQVDEDELFADALEACHAWKAQADEHRARQRAACQEWREKLGPDVARLVRGLGMGDADRAELLFRRYPAVLSYLLGRDLGNALVRPYAPKADVNARRQLSDDGLRRFQRVIGARATLQWAKDRDAADVYNDLLDAVNVGLDAEEVLEYIGAKDA